jgi:signal transduction histidine kinase
MKISNLIFVGFLLILVMFSAATYMNFRQAEQVNENSEFISRSSTIIRQSNRFQRNILNMISGLRGYLFTGENYFIQAYDSAARENVDILNELFILVPDSSLQRSALEEIRFMNTQWLSSFAEPLLQAKKVAGSSDSSQRAFSNIYREKLLGGAEANFNRRLQKKLRDFTNYEYTLRDARKAELTAAVQFTRKISFYLTTLSIVIGFAIAVLLTYRISSRILKMVKLADNIAAGNYQPQEIDVGKDELSNLAISLNHMAKVLSENIALLERKNDELSQFAHIASHDLKAPLRGIDNVITWIQEDHSHELPPKVAEYIELIKGRLIRAENLIQGILLYSRVGRELPEREQVDLNQLISETIESIAPDTQLTIIVQDDLPVINTERIPLQQIISNLVSNAIKHHNKSNGKVEIRVVDKGSYLVFHVKDDGPGIERIYHEKIFQIFQTLHERDSFESTGVGLAIVKKILDDRKQQINLVSSAGKGSDFSFTWPK